jgi:hypothetical protein
MQVSETKTILETAHYRYKLNENAGAESVSVEGTHLTKSNWLVSMHKLRKLDNYIRTTTNPTGIVDCDEFVPTSGKVLNSNVENMQAEPKEFEQRDLEDLSRAELDRIAAYYNIKSNSVVTDVLIKNILQAQRTKFGRNLKKKEKAKEVEAEVKTEATPVVEPKEETKEAE